MDRMFLELLEWNLDAMIHGFACDADTTHHSLERLKGRKLTEITLQM